MNHHAVTLALLSAALLGFSTLGAKALLGSVEPAVLPVCSTTAPDLGGCQAIGDSEGVGDTAQFG